MEFGVLLPPTLGVASDPVALTRFAQHVEAAGFDELSVVEHSVVIHGTRSAYPYSPDGSYPLADECPLPDPLDLLAFVAARTTTLRLSTAVLVLPNHHPVVLAKRLATVDVLSQGRL